MRMISVYTGKVEAMVGKKMSKQIGEHTSEKVGTHGSSKTGTKETVEWPDQQRP